MRTSVGPRLGEIKIPTRVITAVDDPIVPAEPLVHYARGTHRSKCKSPNTADISASSPTAAKIPIGGG